MNKITHAEHDVPSRPDLPSVSLQISFVEFVGLTAALMALTALSIDIMLPALPKIGSALGASSENDNQLIVILYIAGFAAGQLIYGPLSDHLGRRPASGASSRSRTQKWALGRTSNLIWIKAVHRGVARLK